jgi:hypothetical protein
MIAPSANGHSHRDENTTVCDGNATPRLASSQASAAPSQTGCNGDKTLLPKAEDRDAQTGRFVAGNKAGRGNPFTRRLAAMRQVILDTIDATKLRQLVEALFAQALAGDVAAARTLLAYVVGKPSSSVDPDALDRDEWRRCEEWPHGADVLAALGRDSTPRRPVSCIDQCRPRRRSTVVW